MEKVNQRIALTKRLLKDSLVQLLETESIETVSIRELCDNAGINRSTFYNYYGSPLDLLYEIESDFLTLVKENLEDTAITENYLQSIGSIAAFAEQNLKLTRLLLNNTVDPEFPRKLFGLPQVQTLLNKRLDHYYPPQKLSYAMTFLIFGCFNTIRQWINKEERESPQTIAELLMEFCNKLCSETA